MTQALDVVILEVGLGGRLDTVNAFDADCAIVTSIDLDHQEFLGDTREKIAFEKAAIYRPNTPAICGDNVPPISLVDYAKAINAQFLSIHEAFAYSESAAHDNQYWTFHTHALLEQSMLSRQKNAVQSPEFELIFELPVPNLSGHYQLNNAACAIAAVQSLQTYLPVPVPNIAQAMLQVTLAGRFQTVLSRPHVILDVAHNPHAARALNANLQTLIAQNNCKIIAVFAMLADKDIQGVVDTLVPVIDAWFVAPIDHVRGASIDDLSTALLRANVQKNINCFTAVNAAYNAAIINAETRIEQGENVKIIVFGSFFTVAAVMEVIASKSAD